MAFTDRDPHRSHPARAVLLATACVVGFFVATLACADAPSIIPNPASMRAGEGTFRLHDGTPIIVAPGDAQAKQAAHYLAQLVWRTHRLHLPVRTGRARDAAIVLARNRDEAAQSYRLEVSARRIKISAPQYAGLLYGGITLWQLIPLQHAKVAAVPALSIEDAPRFAWRGIMLDSARHYQSPAFVRELIDWMALHKLNRLHWHLTDDQAWRLEIRKYPRLTEIGAWRVPAGPAAQADIDRATGKPRLYGGFYSQKTVRALVAYARAHGITIVPEIEMPGHASAALAAYPALGELPVPLSGVPADWGIYANVYSPAESTFRFLEDVLTEVMALFPSRFIHIGGDEVATEQWAHAPATKARMRELGIADAAGVQAYFTQRIGRFLAAHGRRLVGWDEILTPGMLDSAVVMSWRGIDGALAAVAKGYDTVLSPWPTLYFDNRQGNGSDEPPGRVKVISVEDVYRFEPMPAALPEGERAHVLGLQGNVWTEHIRTEARVGHMSFPRAAAVAEVAWSPPERREWSDFARRLAALLKRYDALGIPHADSAFAVQARIDYAPSRDAASVRLSTQAGVGEIRYTTEGAAPDAHSPRYAHALRLPVPSELHVNTFVAGEPVARARTIALTRANAGHRSSRELQLCSENIALLLEDDAPLAGPRAVFNVDIENPCWIFPRASLDGVTSITAAVGQVPFNFQIGDEIKKIALATPTTPEGELEVHLDRCDGELIARLALAPARASNAVTTLPQHAIKPLTGEHDLCLKFAQRFAYALHDPLWVLDWIQLTQHEPPPAMHAQ